MLAKRVVVCLDVKSDRVVKGVEFKNHVDVGGIVELAQKYSEQGADELVLYDITASSENRRVSKSWIEEIAKYVSIPFCVAGGIRSVKDAEEILNSGADKVSINSPALENPHLITEIANEFGSQAVVLGIDSREEKGDYFVYQYTGSESSTTATNKRTLDWIKQGEELGAGEIVLNCMNQDGRRQGFDSKQLDLATQACQLPVIASGGAGSPQHFVDVFSETNVSGALGASLFHIKNCPVSDVKNAMLRAGLPTRGGLL